jgi:benzodiazapine receptor
MITRQNIPLFTACILISFLPGFINVTSMGSEQKSSWYIENKPYFTPPGIVFPIVWNVLYFMLGVSLYLAVDIKGKLGEDMMYVLGLYVVNLVLNSLWTPAFFGYKMFRLGYALTISMIIVTLLIILNDSVNLASKCLLVPYVLWLCFASVLNLHFIAGADTALHNNKIETSSH